MLPPETEMIPLELRPASARRPGVISVTAPSRGRAGPLAASVASLRDLATRPDLTEILIAWDPDDEVTGKTAADLGADVSWRAPQRYGFTRQSRYYAELLAQAAGEWFLLWSDDAVMTTQGWDEKLRGLPPGWVAYTDGNYPGLTCFPAVHMDALAAIGRLSPLPSLDSWFEDVGRAAGVLVSPGIYVRQDRPDLNGRNDDATHREGGGAWRQANIEYGQPYYAEPFATWRAQDIAALRAWHEARR
jgi:hypothetical protein